jgi:hypothetical protein
MLARLGFGAGRLRPPPSATFDAELLDGVAAFVETEQFLQHLESKGGGSPHFALVDRPATAPAPAPGPSSSSSHDPAPAPSACSRSGVLVAPAAEGGFVVVTREDAVEAMAYFIADCLSRSPETAGLDPKQLQKALGEAMVTLKRARWRAVLGWGRVAVAALSYGASVAFAAGGGGAPPAVYRAVVAALWAAARMAYRAVA